MSEGRIETIASRLRAAVDRADKLLSEDLADLESHDAGAESAYRSLLEAGRCLSAGMGELRQGLSTVVVSQDIQECHDTNR